MKLVSEALILAETAASHLKDDLSSRKIFASHLTLIYSLCDNISLDKKFTLNKSKSGIVLRKERSLPPTVNHNSKVQLLTNHTERRERR